MPDWTRRRALSAVATGFAALAGCAGSEDELVTIDYRGYRRPLENYELERVRNDEGAVLFAREAVLSATEERERGARGGHHVVVTEDRFDRIAFGDADEAQQLRSFAAETDFTESTLYLLAETIDACHDLRLQSVTIEWDGSDDIEPHAQFCQSVRPADVACSSETTHTVGFAIRLPVAAEQSTGSGRGWSQTCRPRSPRGEYFDATVTPAGGDDS